MPSGTRRRIRLLLTGSILAVLGAGCDSVAAPQRPLARTYDLTTVLDTFSFETSPYMVPGCEGALMYCTLRRPMTEATLGGLLVLSGESGPTGTATAQTTGRFCEAYDWRVPSGCTTLGPSVDRDYPYGSVSITTWAGNAPDSVVIQLGRAGPIGQDMPTIYLWGRRVGSDIVGRIYWSLTINRSPPSHRGTFIARLRR